MTKSSAVSFSVANITPGVVRAEFMQSMMALVEYEREVQRQCDPLASRTRFDRFYQHFAGPYLDDERNRCVAWFFDQTESDYLLFIDSDIKFDPHQAFELVTLAASQHLGVLSGVYYNSYASDIRPVLYRWIENEEGQRRLETLSCKEVAEFAKVDAYTSIDGCGAGFLAISRETLKAVGETFTSATPWFAEVAVDGIHLGEDLTFCLRAKHVGFDSFMAPSIQVEHVKTCVIRPEL